MEKKNLTKNYLLLIVLTVFLVILIVLFTKLNPIKPHTSEGIPSLSLWKPLKGLSETLNISENESLIEKNERIETPSDKEVIKETFKQYWVSYLILFFIVVLFIVWIVILIKIYNG